MKKIIFMFAIVLGFMAVNSNAHAAAGLGPRSRRSVTVIYVTPSAQGRTVVYYQPQATHNRLYVQPSYHPHNSCSHSHNNNYSHHQSMHNNGNYHHDMQHHNGHHYGYNNGLHHNGHNSQGHQHSGQQNQGNHQQNQGQQNNGPQNERPQNNGQGGGYQR